LATATASPRQPRQLPVGSPRSATSSTEIDNSSPRLNIGRGSYVRATMNDDPRRNPFLSVRGPEKPCAARLNLLTGRQCAMSCRDAHESLLSALCAEFILHPFFKERNALLFAAQSTASAVAAEAPFFIALSRVNVRAVFAVGRIRAHRADALRY
jgi:hypothetical protein